MRSIHRRLMVPVVVIAGLIPAACGTGAGVSRTSVTSAATGACQAAPAPPDHQAGWSSASQAPTVFPVLVNSSGSLTCGANRLLFTFLDSQNAPVATPDRTASISLYNLGRNGDTPTETQDGTFVWGIDNVRGFFVANMSFPEAGTWGAQFTTAVGKAAPETIRMTFDVATTSPVIRVGQAAPATETPTGASVNGDLAKISTDTNPDPAFYKVSVKDALAGHQPFVLIFATPKFCTTAQCGPTLDRLKPIADANPTVDFMHVEPYQMAFQNGGLQPILDAHGYLQSIPAVNQWGILSEPWVFVVDRTGIVVASFEGVVSAAEITAAVDKVR